MKLHYYQKELLKKLTLSKNHLKFNELLLKGLTSEHMNYHLKQLISLKLAKKENDKYLLTNKGKDYTDSLEDDIKTEEKQPKTSIIVRAVRTNKDGGQEQLVCKRLRHPYYGKVGRITGKVRFGEKLEDTVKRELYEETGLETESINLLRIYRKLRFDKDNNTVQDVFFYIFGIKNLKGNLIEKSQFQENFWITKEEYKKRNDFYKDFVWNEQKPKDSSLFEENIDLPHGY
jgi:ADP-ribose pyrophosphatase YjhB (NUDIX family)